MSVIFFIKTTFNSDLNHILNCVNKCDFGTKCFAKVEHFVLRLIPLTMSKAEVLKHLQDKERPCELALEGSRWYDLVRWGIVEETLKAHNKPFVENYVDTKHQLFPIPHSEFLLNPDWEQNPNYSK